MRRTKLAAHHMTGGGETEQWIAVSTGLKCVMDYGPSLAARAAGLPVVGRELDDGRLDGQGFDINRHCLREGRDPAEWARVYVNNVLSEKMALNPGIDWWSGPNEQNFERDGREATDPALAASMQADREKVMRWYGEFLWHFAKEMHWRGKRAVIGGWAVGNPLKEHNLWPHYTKALQACKDWGAIQERHSYGPLTEDYSLRHRWDNREWAKLGYPGLPVIISECGGDDVPGSGPPRVFYQTAQRFWDELLRPFALEIEKDDYVLFAAVFTSGQGGGGSWPNFDITGWGLTKLVVDFANSREPLPPPPPEEDDMDPIKKAAIIGHLDAIRALLDDAPLPPADWWESWPTGFITPPRKLALPPAPIQMYRADGTAIAGVLRRNNMDAHERQGELIRVTSQAINGVFWWVRQQDVQPI